MAPCPPTGKSTSSDYVYVMEFEDGKISHLTKIWNAGWAMSQGVQALERAGKTDASAWQERTEERHELVSPALLLDPPAVPAILVLSPYRMNERLRTQKSTFVVPGGTCRRAAIHSGVISAATVMPRTSIV